MGKSAVGWVVSHSLKSGWGLARFSKAFSSSFSQWMSRWQFCSISQCPRWAAVSSNCSATCSRQQTIFMHAVCMHTCTHTTRTCIWAINNSVPSPDPVPWPETWICFPHTPFYLPVCPGLQLDPHRDSGWTQLVTVALTDHRRYQNWPQEESRTALPSYPLQS